MQKLVDQELLTDVDYLAFQAYSESGGFANLAVGVYVVFTGGKFIGWAESFDKAMKMDGLKNRQGDALVQQLVVEDIR